jgi:signal transduction histidine kinase
MILLLTASERSQECATALQVATGQPTHCVGALFDAIGRLRSSEYQAAVLDQCVLDADPEQADLLIQHLGTATPVYVHGALAGIERIVGDVRTALSRRQIEICNARNHAESALRSELREPLTALLLNCDLLLEMSTLDQGARSKIEAIQEMGRHLADRLEVHDTTATHA